MRNYLLAATTAVALLATGTVDTLAQRSNDTNQRWIGVTNDSNFDVQSIEMIPSSKDCCWSRDLLEGEILPKKGPKANSMLLDFDEGSGQCLFDILARARSGNRHLYFEEINVCRQSEIVLKGSAHDGKDRRMTVKNESGPTAWFAYVIPSDSECCWSRDLLGKEIITHRESLPVNFDDGYGRCRFDILVRGGTLVKNKIQITRDWYFKKRNVCSQAGLPLKVLPLKVSSDDGIARRMMVINESELTAARVYAIPSGNECCWSRDLLGMDIIEPRRSLRVDFDDGYGRCRFDILVRGGPRDGNEVPVTRDWYFERIDVCRQADLPLNASSNDGKHRKITVKNDSILTAEKVYAMPSSRDCCWSHNLLGKDAIEGGKSLSVNFDEAMLFLTYRIEDGSGECTFDIRITSNGPGIEWNFDSVDVCNPGGNERTITLR